MEEIVESKMKLSVAKFNRRIKQRNGFKVAALSLLLTGLIAAGLSAGWRGGQAQSGGQAPDYEQVDDFLDGATHLLRNDDLVMTFNYKVVDQRGEIRFRVPPLGC